MYILINLLILFITLFLYIHIYFHIKTSNYLEVYEIDNITKEKLEELCSLKQPLLLTIDGIEELVPNITLDYLQNNYGTFDIKIYDKSKPELCVPMNLITALELFSKDSSSNYISEFNNEFLDETSIEKNYNSSDSFFRPYGISNIDYDIIIGSINSYTNFKYTLNCRNLFYVNNGSVEITLCPPKNHKYLYVKEDNHNLEYYSSIDINNVDAIYKKDFDKVKLLRVTMSKGQMIQIPAFWFFSIKLLEKDTIVLGYKYRTFMNTIAILPQLFVKFLQDNNIKRNVLKIVDT